MTKPGLKTQISLTLLVLLSLASLLTVIVTTVFWLRETAQSFAREKESEVFLRIAQRGQERHPSADAATMLAEILSESRSSGGALVGCFADAGGKAVCDPSDALERASLEQVLAQSLVSGESARQLVGLAWVGFIPGKATLDLALQPALPGGRTAALALRYSLEPAYAGIRHYQRYIYIYVGVNLMILVVIGFFRLLQTVVRPIEHLVRLTDSYTDDSGVPFLSLDRGSEIGQLGGSLQRMLDRIREDRDKLQESVRSLQAVNRELVATREEMVRTETLSSVGRLAAGLAHEIGNPVGIVQGYLGLIRQRDLSEAEKADFCARAEQELQRIAALVRQLLDLARPASGREELVDMHEMLREALALLRPQPLMDGITLGDDLGLEAVMVRADRAQLRQVLLNCLINAADSVREAGREDAGEIRVRSETVAGEQGRRLRVLISDNGTGLSEDEVANAFNPFFTTKAPGKGTGLGLTVSHALLKGMGGGITIANRDGGGAVVTVLLPLAGE